MASVLVYTVVIYYMVIHIHMQSIYMVIQVINNIDYIVTLNYVMIITNILSLIIK